MWTPLYKYYIDDIIIVGDRYHVKCEPHFINITLMTSLYLVIGITFKCEHHIISWRDIPDFS
jgi:hypothetical protein